MKTTITTNFVVALQMKGTWYKAGVITHNKKFTLDTPSKKNFTGDNRQRLLESCEYLLEETLAQSVEWRLANGNLAKTHKVKNSNNQA